MTKAELVDKIYAKSGLPTKAKSEAALDATIEAITECLTAGDSITLTGFGSFKVTKRAARKGRNPRTGKECLIPASRVVKFTPGKTLKEAVK
mgnify:CR=1 FL=1